MNVKWTDCCRRCSRRRRQFCSIDVKRERILVIILRSFIAYFRWNKSRTNSDDTSGDDGHNFIVAMEPMNADDGAEMNDV